MTALHSRPPSCVSFCYLLLLTVHIAEFRILKCPAVIVDLFISLPCPFFCFRNSKTMLEIYETFKLFLYIWFTFSSSWIGHCCMSCAFPNLYFPNCMSCVTSTSNSFQKPVFLMSFSSMVRNMLFYSVWQFLSSVEMLSLLLLRK